VGQADQSRVLHGPARCLLRDHLAADHRIHPGAGRRSRHRRVEDHRSRHRLAADRQSRRLQVHWGENILLDLPAEDHLDRAADHRARDLLAHALR
jgi:hypothetical protein